MKESRQGCCAVTCIDMVSVMIQWFYGFSTRLSELRSWCCSGSNPVPLIDCTITITNYLYSLLFSFFPYHYLLYLFIIFFSPTHYTHLNHSNCKMFISNVIILTISSLLVLFYICIMPKKINKFGAFQRLDWSYRCGRIWRATTS